MPLRFNAVRFWTAIALALTVAGALAAREPVETALQPYQTLYSGAI